ncbi:hypothetical protein ACHAW6_014507, partial [Cyclotella cf. meneghiniana]
MLFKSSYLIVLVVVPVSGQLAGCYPPWHFGGAYLSGSRVSATSTFNTTDTSGTITMVSVTKNFECISGSQHCPIQNPSDPVQAAVAWFDIEECSGSIPWPGTPAPTPLPTHVLRNGIGYPKTLINNELYKGGNLVEAAGMAYRCLSQTKITPAYGAAEDNFGNSVSISGNVVVVGANYDNDIGDASGAAYIFELNESTGGWNQKAKLTAYDGAGGDYFGASVGISGNFVVVGAYLDDDKGSNSGSAYIFELNESTGAWDQKAKLTAADGAANDYFGYSVSISGNIVVVGAHLEDEKGDNSGSAYIFELNENTGVWSQKAKLTAADGSAGDHFGRSVSISEKFVVIGAYLDDDKGTDSGSAYIFELNENTGVWNQKTKLTAPDGAASDYFGYSVSISGNVAVVGAYLDDDKGGNSGSAYIFELNESTGVWNQKAKLTAADGAGGDYFGYSVSISDKVVVVGAYLDDDKGGSSGSAYMFELNEITGTWNQKAKLTAPDGSSGDNFGNSVSISGNVVVVGAYLDDAKGTDSGSAYIFDLNERTCAWNQNAKLTAADGSASDYFGWSVSISGNFAVVGAYSDDDKGTDSGSAYIFELNEITGVWNQKAKLVPADGSAGDYFGRSVAISGNLVVVGAYLDDDKGSNSGAAYIFELNEGTGTWNQKAKLTAADGAAYDYFGYSVSISGNIVVVGAYVDNDKGTDSGSAYIFELNENTGAWDQKAKLTAADGATMNYFGYSVSISGNAVVVGAYLDDDKGSNSGSAYIFELNESTGVWNQKAKLIASDGAANDYFGYSVSISRNVVVVGACYDDAKGTDSGSVYIFEFNKITGTWNQKAKLTAADGVSSDYFGTSVAISGSVVIVGAYSDDDKGTESGSAYIYELDESTGVYREKAKLTAADGAGGDYFGYSVSISGNIAVVGAYLDDDRGSNSGSAYIFFGTLSKIPSTSPSEPPSI